MEIKHTTGNNGNEEQKPKKTEEFEEISLNEPEVNKQKPHVIEIQSNQDSEPQKYVETQHPSSIGSVSSKKENLKIKHVKKLHHKMKSKSSSTPKINSSKEFDIDTFTSDFDNISEWEEEKKGEYEKYLFMVKKKI